MSGGPSFILDSIRSKDAQQDAEYVDAWRELTGIEDLKECMTLVHQHAQESGELARKLNIHRWQQDVAFESLPLAELYCDAGRVRGEFTQVVKSLCKELAVGGIDVFTHPKDGVVPMKSWDRAQSKVRRKFSGDCSRLVDLVRGTIVVKNPESGNVLSQLYTAVSILSSSRLMQRKSCFWIEFNDRLQNPPGGVGAYGDCTFMMNVLGHVAELQVTTEAFYRIKQFGSGHQTYEVARRVNESVLELASSLVWRINDFAYEIIDDEDSKNVRKQSVLDTLCEAKSPPNEVRDREYTRKIATRELVRLLQGDEATNCPPADPNAVREQNTGFTALHYASLFGEEEAVMALLKHKANVFASDRSGRLPLSLAVSRSRWEVVKLLVPAMLQTVRESQHTMAAWPRNTSTWSGVERKATLTLCLPKKGENQEHMLAFEWTEESKEAKEPQIFTMQESSIHHGPTWSSPDGASIVFSDNNHLQVNLPAPAKPEIWSRDEAVHHSNWIQGQLDKAREEIVAVWKWAVERLDSEESEQILGIMEDLLKLAVQCGTDTACGQNALDYAVELGSSAAFDWLEKHFSMQPLWYSPKHPRFADRLLKLLAQNACCGVEESILHKNIQHIIKQIVPAKDRLQQTAQNVIFISDRECGGVYQIIGSRWGRPKYVHSANTEFGIRWSTGAWGIWRSKRLMYKVVSNDCVPPVKGWRPFPGPLTMVMLPAISVQTMLSNQLLAAFRASDTDGDGVLSFTEAKRALKSLGSAFVDDEEMKDFFAQSDGDKNGALDEVEFSNLVRTLQSRGGIFPLMLKDQDGDVSHNLYHEGDPQQHLFLQDADLGAPWAPNSKEDQLLPSGLTVARAVPVPSPVRCNATVSTKERTCDALDEAVQNLRRSFRGSPPSFVFCSLTSNHDISDAVNGLRNAGEVWGVPVIGCTTAGGILLSGSWNTGHALGLWGYLDYHGHCEVDFLDYVTAVVEDEGASAAEAAMSRSQQIMNGIEMRVRSAWLRAKYKLQPACCPCGSWEKCVCLGPPDFLYVTSTPGDEDALLKGIHAGLGEAATKTIVHGGTAADAKVLGAWKVFISSPAWDPRLDETGRPTRTPRRVSENVLSIIPERTSWVSGSGAAVALCWLAVETSAVFSSGFTCPDEAGTQGGSAQAEVTELWPSDCTVSRGIARVRRVEKSDLETSEPGAEEIPAATWWGQELHKLAKALSCNSPEERVQKKAALLLGDAVQGLARISLKTEDDVHLLCKHLVSEAIKIDGIEGANSSLLVKLHDTNMSLEFYDCRLGQDAILLGACKESPTSLQTLETVQEVELLGKELPVVLVFADPHSMVRTGGVAVLGPSTSFPFGQSLKKRSGENSVRILHPSSVLKNGVVNAFAEVSVGDRLIVMRGDEPSLCVTPANEILNKLDAIGWKLSDLTGALAVICGGVQFFLQEPGMCSCSEQLLAVLGRQVPTLGCCCFGEQGQPDGPGTKPAHGNLMFSMLLFSNRPKSGFDSMLATLEGVNIKKGMPFMRIPRAIAPSSGGRESQPKNGVSSGEGEKTTASIQDELVAKFRQLDQNKDGRVKSDELQRVLKKLNPDFTDADVEKIFSSIDRDNNGSIDISEFIDRLFKGNGCAMNGPSV